MPRFLTPRNQLQGELWKVWIVILSVIFLTRKCEEMKRETFKVLSSIRKAEARIAKSELFEIKFVEDV